MLVWCTLVLLGCLGCSLGEKLENLNVLGKLQQYGHVKVQANGMTMLDKATLTGAIKNFQHFAAINETGELDAATLNALVAKRCGNPDIVSDDDYENEHSRRRRFVLVEDSFQKLELKYKIEIYSTKMSVEDQNYQVRLSFEQWANHSGLSFTQVFDDSPADLFIKFVKKEHGDDYPFDGPGSVLAHAFFPKTGIAHFDDDENWALNPEDGTFFGYVSLHEFGHLLGLKHTDNFKAVMAPYYKTDPNPKLHLDDIEGIVQLYSAVRLGATRTCKNDKSGESYEGFLAETTSGLKCQMWKDQTPHKHSLKAVNFYSGTLSQNMNYCRNPDSKNKPNGPWCYTQNTTVEWEYCDVSLCTFKSKLTVLGLEYIGTVRKTASGKTCQKWSSTSPHNHHFSTNEEYYPHGTPRTNENFCRNPDNDPVGPWCYTTDPDKRWEPCDIPYGVKRCQIRGKSEIYYGTASQTVSGHTCQRWDTQTPQRHKIYDAHGFPAGNIKTNENYCRNPLPGDHPDGVWCYTTNPQVVWEYCDVPFCETQCRDSEQGLSYSGKLAETKSKRKCQRWDSQEPHRHGQIFDSSMPEATATEASNYCRNPDKDSAPWCYTTDPLVRWEYCDIPLCSEM